MLRTDTRLSLIQNLIILPRRRGVTGLKAQMGSSLTAGFVASVFATPTDVALVRMTADRRLPENEQRKYKHVIDALIRMAREEGVTALWTGVTPTVLRAMLGNLTQLTSYVQTKHRLIESGYMHDGVACHFVSSLISGLVYAFSTAPLDMAKTRVQTMKTVNGKGEYSGLWDVWVKTFKKEGTTALWKGFGPYYFKIAPNTVLLFVFAEKLTYLFKKYVAGDVTTKGGF